MSFLTAVHWDEEPAYSPHAEKAGFSDLKVLGITSSFAGAFLAEC